MKTLCMLISFYQLRLDFVCRIFYLMAYVLMLRLRLLLLRTLWSDTNFWFSNFCTDFFLAFLHIRSTHFSWYTKSETERGQKSENTISVMLLIYCTIWFRPCCRDNAFQISTKMLNIVFWILTKSVSSIFMFCLFRTHRSYWKSKPKKEK